jgi:phosphohistidine phosphatase
MELFFMRHAEAEPRDRYPTDQQRPLSTAGRETHCRVARVLIPLLQPLGYLLSSPILRARQTADIMAEALQFEGQIEETRVLGEACTVGAVLSLLQGYPSSARLLCVGHEPAMSQLSAVFLDGEGRSTLAFQPGSVIGLIFRGHPEPGRGSLRVFLRPADIVRLAP